MFIKKLAVKTTVLGSCALFVAQGSLAENVDPKNSRYHNNSPISVTGKVVQSTTKGFVLNYKGGNIFVEVDDWNWTDNEASDIKVGDKVTVHGDIDQDLYESRKIEAGGVYVHNTKSYYFADSDDEEDFYSSPYFYTNQSAIDNMPDGAWVSVRGTVEEIDGREFKLDLGETMIMVDTSDLDYNPFDDVGYQKISVGDRVYVSGDIDVSFFEQKEIEADQIFELKKMASAF